MSGAEAEEVVRSAVPVPDLSFLAEALRCPVDRLREAVQKARRGPYFTVAQLTVAQLQ